MQITVLCIGKTDSTEIRNLLDYYVQRLPKHFNFLLVEIPDVKHARHLSSMQIKEEEAEQFQRHLHGGETLILLDEKGKSYTSREFSKKIQNWMNLSIKHLVFLIGGAYGFSPKIYDLAPQRISLSKMTFTHQMIRLFFVEQIYRASTILDGKPYHND